MDETQSQQGVIFLKLHLLISLFTLCTFFQQTTRQLFTYTILIVEQN